MQKFPSSEHWTSKKACCSKNLFQTAWLPAVLPHLLHFSITSAALNKKLWHHLKLQGSIYQSVRYSPPSYLLSGYVHRHCIRGGLCDSDLFIFLVVKSVGQLSVDGGTNNITRSTGITQFSTSCSSKLLIKRPYQQLGFPFRCGAKLSHCMGGTGWLQRLRNKKGLESFLHPAIPPADFLPVSTSCLHPI